MRNDLHTNGLRVDALSFRSQLTALFWKNWIVIKRNILAVLLELSLSIFFVFTLLIMRHIIERIKQPEQRNPSYHVIDYFQNLPYHYLILYSPDTPIVEQVVRHGYELIKARKSWLNLTSKQFI